MLKRIGVYIILKDTLVIYTVVLLIVHLLFVIKAIKDVTKIRTA